ncbi:MAG: LysR substrate-binding domain-containing protein [Geminicoccaceae bacterium]
MPSLNALRAFEVTCRHLNYVRAAEELRVTPAAVKQLVRSLEQALDIELVLRSGRGVVITAAGQAGLDELTGGFRLIQQAVGRMRAHQARRRLIVSVEPSFATAWLVPRLERFRGGNPDIDVLIDSSLQLVDLAKNAADIAVRFGAPPGEGLVVERLFDERLCAFCSPSLTRGVQRLRRLDDLARATLLHWDMSALTWAAVTRKWMEWRVWLEMVGATQVDWRRGVRFSDYNLAVQAAIAGQGVVLGSLPILRDLVEARLLVRPFAACVETGIGYDIVATPEALERPEVHSFVEWIRAEADLAKTAAAQRTG